MDKTSFAVNFPSHDALVICMGLGNVSGKPLINYQQLNSALPVRFSWSQDHPSRRYIRHWMACQPFDLLFSPFTPQHSVSGSS